MQKEFSIDFMKANCGCYSEKRLFACSFMKFPVVLLSDIVESEIPLEHKYWFVCKKLLSSDECRKVAICLAEIVLPIFEVRYPDDKRPLEAIEAAKSYLAGNSSTDFLEKKYAAAYAAAADAVAANAVYAANAAYAAAVAANAYVAAANAAAAAAADAAAADAAYRTKIMDYLRELCR
jgi:hypothetical protein